MQSVSDTGMTCAVSSERCTDTGMTHAVSSERCTDTGMTRAVSQLVIQRLCHTIYCKQIDTPVVSSNT